MVNTMKTVRDLMSSSVVALDSRASVNEAAHRMKAASVGDVVVTQGGSIHGILTDRDIVVRCLAEDKNPDATEVGSICTKKLMTLSPDASIDEAIRMMETHAVRRLPVVDGDRAVGVVSIGDLAVDRDRTSALGQISDAPPNV